MWDNQVTLFLKKEVLENSEFKRNDNLHGKIKLDDLNGIIGGNSKISLSSGSVYGIFAIETENSNINQLINEVNDKKTKELKDYGSIMTDGNNKIYPIYWGKDINPGSRIVAHSRHYPGTGNAELEKYPALRNFNLIYGSIYVTKYRDFEDHLFKKYQPLLGTNKVGKESKITLIEPVDPSKWYT